MEHSCYKCGHNVEEGKPFCVNCGAPQIRVAMPEVPAPPGAGASAAELPIFADSTMVPGTPGTAMLTPGIVWPIAMRSCGLAALIAAAVMAFGLIVPLFAILAAGILAVNLYRRQNPVWAPRGRDGAFLGAVCGALFFAISAIFEALATAVFRNGGELRQKMLDALQQAASRSSDPQVQAAFDQLKTPEGIAVMMIFAFVFSILVCALAGGLTGAFLGRSRRG